MKHFLNAHGGEVGGLVRHGSTILGGVLFATGTIGNIDIYLLLMGSVVSIAGIGWSLFNKLSHKKAVKRAFSVDPKTGLVTRYLDKNGEWKGV